MPEGGKGREKKGPPSPRKHLSPLHTVHPQLQPIHTHTMPTCNTRTIVKEWGVLCGSCNSSYPHQHLWIDLQTSLGRRCKHVSIKKANKHGLSRRLQSIQTSNYARICVCAARVTPRVIPKSDTHEFEAWRAFTRVHPPNTYRNLPLSLAGFRL